MEFQRAKEADFEGKWIPQPAQEKDLAELAAKNAGGLSEFRQDHGGAGKGKNLRHVMVSDEGGVWHVPVPASYFYPGLYEGKRRGTGADALS